MEFEEELKKLLEEWREEAGKIDKSLLPLVDKFIKANEGGKRIRGKLVMLGYEIAVAEDGRRKTEDILKVAAAYEIFHTAILVHDDIIDQDLIRRGQPSLYQALGGNHQGTSLAICLADAGFFLAVKIIAESNFPQKRKNEALKYFSGIILDTAMGQMLDIEKGDYLTVAKYKTAEYSVSGPLILGAILDGAKLDQLGKLDQFGEYLGIAFQIQDDILDGEVAWIRGLDSAKNEAKKYKNKAMKVIPEITKDPKTSKLLRQMAEYLIERNK